MISYPILYWLYEIYGPEVVIHASIGCAIMFLVAWYSPKQTKPEAAEAAEGYGASWDSAER